MYPTGPSDWKAKLRLAGGFWKKNCKKSGKNYRQMFEKWKNLTSQTHFCFSIVESEMHFW